MVGSVTTIHVCSICTATEIEPDDQFCIYCATLVDVAIKALSVARQDAIERYGVTWQNANMSDRLEHAATHIYQHKREDQSEDHLAHAICDLVMCYASH